MEYRNAQGTAVTSLMLYVSRHFFSNVTNRCIVFVVSGRSGPVCRVRECAGGHDNTLLTRYYSLSNLVSRPISALPARFGRLFSIPKTRVRRRLKAAYLAIQKPCAEHSTAIHRQIICAERSKICIDTATSVLAHKGST